MTWIWVLFLFLSTGFALFTGQTDRLSAAAMEGSRQAVTLSLQLAGPLCLWCGLSHLMEHIGLTDRLSRWLSPLLRRLFPQAWQNPSARAAISGNLSANLLGLGNAATPLGIQAVQRMTPVQGSASDEMCRLVVLNTASIQLFPTTVAAVRAGLGSAAPFEILPAVWITSLCSVTVGLFTAKLLERWTR